LRLSAKPVQRMLQEEETPAKQEQAAPVAQPVLPAAQVVPPPAPPVLPAIQPAPPAPINQGAAGADKPKSKLRASVQDFVPKGPVAAKVPQAQIQQQGAAAGKLPGGPIVKPAVPEPPAAEFSNEEYQDAAPAEMANQGGPMGDMFMPNHPPAAFIPHAHAYPGGYGYPMHYNQQHFGAGAAGGAGYQFPQQVLYPQPQFGGGGPAVPYAPHQQAQHPPQNLGHHGAAAGAGPALSSIFGFSASEADLHIKNADQATQESATKTLNAYANASPVETGYLEKIEGLSAFLKGKKVKDVFYVFKKMHKADEGAVYSGVAGDDYFDIKCAYPTLTAQVFHVHKKADGTYYIKPL